MCARAYAYMRACILNHVTRDHRMAKKKKKIKFLQKSNQRHGRADHTNSCSVSQGRGGCLETPYRRVKDTDKTQPREGKCSGRGDALRNMAETATGDIPAFFFKARDTLTQTSQQIFESRNNISFFRRRKKKGDNRTFALASTSQFLFFSLIIFP